MSDPLALSAFWERLHFASRPVFTLQHARKQSIDGGGNMLSSTLGRPKWTALVTLAGGKHDRNLVQETDIDELMGRDGTFLAYDIRNPFPTFDPDGAKIGNREVLIKSKGGDNRSLAIEGLSRRFTVTKTDKLSVLYGTDKRFLCQVMETAAGDVNGETAEFAIWPPMPAAVAVADAVTMIKAPGKFKILAGSYRPGSGTGNSASGGEFSIISVP